MTTAIERIAARRREIQLEIERLTSLLPGLDNALEILEGGNTEAAVKALSADTSTAGKPAAKTDKPLTPAPWPKTLYDVPEQHLHDLHAAGLSDNKITKELQRQGYSCNQGNTSRKLRAMGLRANGRRVPPGRDRVASVESTSSADTESESSQRKRKTADERKEEVSALLEQGKTEEEIMATTGLGRASVKMYCSILKARTKELPGRHAVPVEAEASENDDWDQGPFYRKPADPSVEVAPVTPPKKRRGRPPKKKAPTEEGEYPVIGYAPSGAPQFGSMRMKVIDEKVVDGHRVKVLPPGYAQGAYPQKNVSVRS